MTIQMLNSLVTKNKVIKKMINLKTLMKMKICKIVAIKMIFNKKMK